MFFSFYAVNDRIDFKCLKFWNLFAIFETCQNIWWNETYSEKEIKWNKWNLKWLDTVVVFTGARAHTIDLKLLWHIVVWKSVLFSDSLIKNCKFFFLHLFRKLFSFYNNFFLEWLNMSSNGKFIWIWDINFCTQFIKRERLSLDCDWFSCIKSFKIDLVRTKTSTKMPCPLAEAMESQRIWTNKAQYVDAERKYYTKVRRPYHQK